MDGDSERMLVTRGHGEALCQRFCYESALTRVWQLQAEAVRCAPSSESMAHQCHVQVNVHRFLAVSEQDFDILG